METTWDGEHLRSGHRRGPQVCHGQPQFRDTRVFVSDVLEQVARVSTGSRSPKSGAEAFTHGAIAEVVSLFYRAINRGESTKQTSRDVTNIIETRRLSHLSARIRRQHFDAGASPWLPRVRDDN